ncbi:MAG: hypothetical protein HFI87_02400 [Bacilli bacterium]|nr:hypothetical protein [Bacilli bacterium]
MKRFVKKTLIVFIFLASILVGSANALENNEIYLSDIDYTSDSRAGWGVIQKDKAGDGNKISAKVEGAYYTFDKGMWAHATSTLIYDISAYSNVYKYFSAYVGLNKTASSSSNGVIFKVYTSSDKQNWELVKETGVLKAGTNAELIQIDITNVHYLKLVADSNGSNGNDHSVYADAKLVKSIASANVIDLGNGKVVKLLEEYDRIIKERYTNATLDNKDYELLLLQRTFVKNVGQYALKRFTEESEENKETLNWLFNDVDNLRLYIMGGAPDGGSYYNSLTQLSRLYYNYKNDFLNNGKLNNKWYPNMSYGDLYKKMAITLSLTHSQRVGLWMQSGISENQSDAVRRYAIFKYLHKNGNFHAMDNVDITPWFEALTVEEMRFVMNNAIDDEEILWLNDYVQNMLDKYKANRYLTPHPYIAYVWPNYQNNVYYDEQNKNYFNELFAVNKTDANKGLSFNTVDGQEKIGLFDSIYQIPGGVEQPVYEIKVTRGDSNYKLYKVWMNFRNKFGTGAVCGGISKSGSNIRATHGIPATVIGQPGHAALLYYSKDANGKGYWNIDNDVSGWTLSEKGERLLLGWGNGSYARGSYQVVYMALAQEAINDYENLIKAEEMVMLANVYSGDYARQEEIYRQALEMQSINFDAWLGLINVYLANSNKTENDFYALAEEVSQNLKYFPLPMYHLTNLIKPKLVGIINIYKFTLLQTRMLTEASQIPNNTADNYYVYQPSLTRTEANFLLGKIDKSIASFSFDGKNAGKIVLSSRFDGSGVRFDYSLDGKQTWNEVSFTAEEEHALQLTFDQINSITSENDIYVHIVGVNYDENNLYKIDITEQSLPESLYANDLENRIIGINNNIEWRMKGDTNWTSYAIAAPDLTGNKQIEIRASANGTKLTSNSNTYTFTINSDDLTRKYVPVSRLSIVGFSTEAAGQKRYAVNAIDANYNTNWHSAWDGSDTERYIVIKVDKPIYLSEIEYVPGGGGNGKIKNGTIYGSNDGENWEEIKKVSNLTYNNGNVNDYDHGFKNTKHFEINSDKKFQYIKIVADTTTNGRNFFMARMFNIYEDATKLPKNPTAEISYSTTNSTNDEVIAKLINPSTKITITNNNGLDSYRFTENGTFTFEFVSEDGLKGTTIATVNWIDKDIPTADVEYNIDSDNKLKILLDGISEDVYLLDKDNKKISYIEVKNNKVSSIHYLDADENITKTIEVDENGTITKIIYKNTTGNVGLVDTYVTTLENGIIVKEEWFDSSKNNIIAGNQYVDDMGHSVSVSQSQLDSLKSLQQPIKSPLEYTFDGSGDYEFKFQDKASNIAYKSIKVDYIDNKTTVIASDITYNITKLTNKDVVATINPYIIDIDKKEAVMVNGHGKTHTFTENGEFIFEYKDPDDTENWEVKSHIATVDWIDKNPPTASINYSTKEETDKVIVTLINESEPIKILNNNANREYTFTKNGTFTFEIMDLAGNTNKVVATVDWIKKPDDVWEGPEEDKPDDSKPSKPVIPEKPDDIVIIPDNQFGNANNQIVDSNNQDDETDADIDDKRPVDNEKPTISENKPNKDKPNKNDNENSNNEVKIEKSNTWLKITIIVVSVVIVSVLGLIIKRRYDNK